MKSIKLFFSVLSLQLLPFSVSAQNISTIAGNGTPGFSGDGGPATSAQLNNNSAIAMDNTGNLYIADITNNRIRKVDVNGIISTIAGNGTSGYSGDGGQAINAQLDWPEGVCVDNQGNIYIADQHNNRIRKVNPAGIISTFAGTGSGNYNGDGITATSAHLNNPLSVAADNNGNIYIADRSNARIRKVDVSGIITTVAGNGNQGFSGDGGQATLAQIGEPKSVAVDNNGNIYIGDFDNARIRKVDANGLISTVAGTGTAGFSGDGGPAMQAQISGYWGGVFVDDFSNLFITDDNNRVRKVSNNGVIQTIAGNGSTGYTGDGGPATAAQLHSPNLAITNAFGILYISDQQNHAIRKVDFAPSYAADSFNLYINQTCSGPELTVTKSYYSPGMSIHTYFGDGSADTSVILSNYSGGYAHITHAYPNSDNYNIKQYLYYGLNAVDSLSFIYQHQFCASMSVQLYNDKNSNCMYDIGTDINLSNPSLVEVDSNNVAIDTISCTSGIYYTAYGNSGDIYEFKIISSPGNMVTSCPVSGIVSDTLYQGISGTKYIGFECVTGNDFDLGVYAEMPVTGPQDQWGHIYVTNPYCFGPNATLTLQHSPKYEFTGTATPSPASYNGNTLTWNLNNISADNPGPVDIYFMVWESNGVLTAGDTVQNRIIINPIMGDANPQDNSIVVVDTVDASCDPNAIYVYPEDCIDAGTNLEYKITFENVGNAPAQNIYVLDTLPAGLNPSSMQVKFASHNMYVEKIYNGTQVILKFRFPNIMLPDSSDHEGCHGMFIYNIDSKNNLPSGAMINHRAGIYFDYNDPVMTNTAQTVICWPASVTNIEKTNKTIIFPNPADDELIIQCPQPFTDCIITNNIGQVLQHQTTNTKETRLNIKSLPVGIYYINIRGNGINEVQKFLKR